MWYVTMLTGQQPTVPFGRRWITALGALTAGRYGPLGPSSTSR
jgi:hypothetical protein